ncbi:hypothetical protein HF086_009885 [Spodoptera exigua]|uniref:Uncharacterized protein n=1 Tax=Spodoptera exigua TaxID=7107 RepID=A0A922M431_SPOEX|nr:hypothetical protein HF086_009885 [Spodoptera exigua]
MDLPTMNGGFLFIIFQIDPKTGVPYLTGADGTAGLPGPLREWYNFTFSVRGSFTQEGFLQIWGRGSRDSSVILVDSFRVIPPGMDESFCRTYVVNKSPIPALRHQVPLTSVRLTPTTPTFDLFKIVKIKK